MSADLSKYKATVDALEGVVFFFTQNLNALNHLPDWVRNKEEGGLDFEKMARLVAEAKEEIYELERSQNALRPRDFEDVNSEDFILAHSALRIDGYRYQDETCLDVMAIIDRFKETGDFGPITPLDKLACFFLMQRFLGKWGGEYLPKNSLEWKAYRQLFLDTVDVETPQIYAPENEENDIIWQNRIKPRIDECVKIVEEIHKNTDYTDDWKIGGEVLRDD